MSLTISEITPVGLCIVTQDLFDTKRFQQNFGDGLLLRTKDKDIEPKLISVKRELNSKLVQKKFLDGHKTVIINNLDKIILLVLARYVQLDARLTQEIINDCKELMKKVLIAGSFEELARLESVFRSKVTLPVYTLFNISSKGR